MALLAAYAPFTDPGMGWADMLLPLISIKPRAADRWMRKTPFFCALSPDAEAPTPTPHRRPGHAHPPLPSLIVTPAQTQPHINSHPTTQMAAFHWCQLTAGDVAALGGRGGTVRLVDGPTAAALAGAAVDGGQQAGRDASSPDALACQAGVRFPPALPPPRPPPGQLLGEEGGVLPGEEAYTLEGVGVEEEEEEEVVPGAAAAHGALPAPAAGGGGGAAAAASTAAAAAAAAATTAATTGTGPSPPAYETLAACVGPLYGTSAWGLVAWFEHHLDAGVGRFYAYTVEEAWAPTANPVHAVLDHYAAAGVAVVRDWAPIGGRSSRWANGSWYYNQPALHNDCLNRARGLHRHVVFMDTDEFIDAAGWVQRRRGVVTGGGSGSGSDDGGSGSGGGGGGAPSSAPSRPPLDGASGALARAVAAWAALPAYEATHSAGFPCRWWAMLGDGATRRQLTDRDGLASDPDEEPDPPKKKKGGEATAPPPPPPPARPSPSPPHPPLAPTPCTEPLLDRLPYRSASFEPTRSKFVARPDAVLAVEAHYVLEGVGADAAFPHDALHHNHYFIVRDGVAAHPTSPRPVVPGGNASAPGGGLTVPPAGMMEVVDRAWPARFAGSGLRERVVEVAAVACGGL